ncbi:porin [Thalassolituus sp. LLYu03]|uniref:porin n=1 Tax=Thalassolituus sp. LLYu03 TaxID=3421656 RepID=UPI003D26DB14
MKPYLTAVFYTLLLSANGHASELSVNGYVLADAGYFDEFYIKDGDTRSHAADTLHGELRSLSISPAWKHDRFRVKAQYKWQTDHGQWGDVEARVKLNAGHVRFGRSELTTSQEDNLSYDTLPVIDRSLPVRAFSAGHQNLAGLRWQPENSIWRLDIAAYVNDDDYQGSQLRLALSPASQRWLWAIAGEHRNLNDDLFQIKTEAAVHLSDKVIRSPRFYAAEQTLLQSDVTLITPSGWWSGEYWLTQVNSTSGDAFTFHGGYGQWVYNSHGSYRLQDFGMDARRKALADSWDFVIRAEFLDLQDQGYGARVSNVMAGLNYYVTSRLSLLGNVTFSEAAGQLISARATDQQARGQAVSARLRYVF